MRIYDERIAKSDDLEPRPRSAKVDHHNQLLTTTRNSRAFEGGELTSHPLLLRETMQAFLQKEVFNLPLMISSRIAEPPVHRRMADQEPLAIT